MVLGDVWVIRRTFLVVECACNVDTPAETLALFSAAWAFKGETKVTKQNTEQIVDMLYTNRVVISCCLCDTKGEERRRRLHAPRQSHFVCSSLLKLKP